MISSSVYHDLCNNEIWEHLELAKFAYLQLVISDFYMEMLIHFDWIKGKSLLNLSSNNYLGIAGHPLLKTAASQAVQQLGCSATSASVFSMDGDLAPSQQ
ncbi:MAG: hypothetical protein WA125_04000 [Desulfosporosinus sp.]